MVYAAYFVRSDSVSLSKRMWKKLGLKVISVVSLQSQYSTSENVGKISTTAVPRETAIEDANKGSTMNIPREAEYRSGLFSYIMTRYNTQGEDVDRTSTQLQLSIIHILQETEYRSGLFFYIMTGYEADETVIEDVDKTSTT